MSGMIHPPFLNHIDTTMPTDTFHMKVKAALLGQVLGIFKQE
jgi:hypothetical protein